MARAELMARGVRLVFGSFEENLAISYIGRERQVQLVEIMAAMSGPENAKMVIDNFKELVFPGERDRKVRDFAKGKKVLDHLKNVKIYAKVS